jgi:hypothetical protein
MSSNKCQYCSKVLKDNNSLLHQTYCKKINDIFNIDTKIDKVIPHDKTLYPYTDIMPNDKVGDKFLCKYCDKTYDNTHNFKIHYETCSKRYEYEYMNYFGKVKDFKICKYHGVHLYEDFIDANMDIYNKVKKDLISIKRLITFKNGTTILVK